MTSSEEPNLEPIIAYSMNEKEAKAYKICLIWNSLVRKEFPNYKIGRNTHGDPRKSSLFKYSYKLLNETLGILEDKDYFLYIKAQLQVLKACGDEKGHALIDPQCIAGKKAWNRWLLWKSRYNKIKNKSIQIETITANYSKIESELERTKKFLFSKLGNSPTYEQINDTIRELIMIKWISFDKVSPYYALMSPWLKKSLENKKIEEMFSFDMSIYKPALTKEIQDLFKKVFDYEFK